MSKDLQYPTKLAADDVARAASEASGLSIVHIRPLVLPIFQSVADLAHGLSGGGRIMLSGLGTFVIEKTPARPHTYISRIHSDYPYIPSRRKITFKPCRRLVGLMRTPLVEMGEEPPLESMDHPINLSML